MYCISLQVKVILYSPRLCNTSLVLYVKRIARYIRLCSRQTLIVSVFQGESIPLNTFLTHQPVQFSGKMSKKPFCDPEVVISLVEKKPVLWNKLSSTYKHKELTRVAWQDICRSIHTGYDQLNREQQFEFCKYLLKYQSFRSSLKFSSNCYEKMVERP